MYKIVPVEDPSCSLSSLRALYRVDAQHWCRASRKYLRLSKSVDRVVLSRAESTNSLLLLHHSLVRCAVAATSLDDRTRAAASALQVQAMTQR